MFKKKILINIEVTSKCPAHCAMCPRELISQHGNMSLETVSKIISQTDPDFAWEIDLAGRGEPTIHPQFIDILKILKACPVPNCLVTTGIALTPEKLGAIEKYVDRVRLSVSSVHKETFEKVHIGIPYEKTWANIRDLALACSSRVIVHLTGGPVIYQHLPETVSHLRSLGIRQLRLMPLWNRGGHFPSHIEMSQRNQLMEQLNLFPSEKEYSGGNRFSFIADALLGRFLNKKYCAIGDSSLSIAYNGDILGCFQDFGHTSNIGNIMQTTMQKAWRQRKKVLGKMKICQGCDSHKVAILKP